MRPDFTYNYTVKVSDLWQASMYYAYSSYMGVVNAVFIVSSIALAVSRWRTASDVARTVMILLILLFTVIQPLVVWTRAKASLGGVYPVLELNFSREGLFVKKDGQVRQLSWSDIKGAVKKPTILIVYLNDGNGYILRNSVLNKTKDELYDYIIGMKKGDR